tara:strand:+ start:689 stop:1462 length:774 start_codon:yes stop_codon:yes gene_type:complete
MSVISATGFGKLPRLKLSWIIVVVALLLPVHVYGQEKLTTETVGEIERIIHDYLMEHPEVIIESVQKLREKQEAMEMEEGTQNLRAFRDQLENDPLTPIAGNPDGDITIIEFFDYRCGYCKSTLATLLQLLTEDSRVKLVFKEFPILSEESETAARAALAAEMQGQYFTFHNALMGTRLSLTKENILEIAEKYGLDVDRLAIDMESPEVVSQVEANKKLASSLNIRGTPTFVIGEDIVPGAIDIETFREIIRKIRDG